MILWIGAAFLVSAMWAALQFEGGQMESWDEFDHASGIGALRHRASAKHTCVEYMQEMAESCSPTAFDIDSSCP